MFSISRYSIKKKSLIPWVKFIWHFKVKNGNIHHKLLPTDSIDIILNLSNNMVYETSSHKIKAHDFHINGLRNEHSYIHQIGNINVWGISFYPFGLFPFINKSLKNIQNKIIALDTLSAPLAKKLKTVDSCDSNEEINESIEEILCSELKLDNDYINKASLLKNFLRSQDNMSIQDFCKENEINIKTFERMVLHYTGYNPKILLRIKRFQTATNQLISQDSIGLSEIAYDNSFTDQAHFTKEFQKFSGASPLLFQKQKESIKENTKYKYL